jgi:replicative DNA helicase
MNAVELGQVIFIGGRPSSGKTATACSLVRSALRQQTHVLYLAIENAHESIAKRIRPKDEDLPFLHIRDDVFDCASAEEVIAKFVGNFGSGLVVVDYIQLMKGSHEHLLELLHSLGSQKKISGVVLSQMKRTQGGFHVFPNTHGSPSEVLSLGSKAVENT